MDEIIRVSAGGGYVSAAVISSRGLTERARKIHNMSRTATAALGRTLAGAALLAHPLKADGASVTIRIKGGGQIGSIIAVAEPNGAVRCYAANPEAELPSRSDGKLDVGGLVGKDGMLYVIRDIGSGEPYTGGIKLVSGEIAEDIAQYLLISEQTKPAVGLGVLVGGDGKTLAAGGYVITLLPGASAGGEAELTDILEKNIAETGTVTSRYSENPDPWTFAQMLLKGLNPKLLSRTKAEYRCTCSRERVFNALAGIASDEKNDIAEKKEPVEVVCRFCETRYTFSPDEIAGDAL